MPKALIVGAVVIIGALLTMRVFKRWQSRRKRSNEFAVPDPVWSSAEAKLCVGDSENCIGLGQNAVQFLDLHRTNSFELFGCDSNGTCARDTGVTATIDGVKYTASQKDYTQITPNTITLTGEKPMIRLWTEKGYRGRYTVLQGVGDHVISNAMYEKVECPDSYTCSVHNYYYGQTVPDVPDCPGANLDGKGHLCVDTNIGWQETGGLSFTMVPDATA